MVCQLHWLGMNACQWPFLLKLTYKNVTNMKLLYLLPSIRGVDLCA